MNQQTYQRGWAAAEPLPALPHSLEAEQGLLGALISSSDAWTSLPALLQPCHLFEPLHQRILAIILEMGAKSGEVSLFALKSRLEVDGTYQEIGGSEYLSRLIGRASPKAWIERDAKLLRELADRRAVIESCETAINETIDTGSDDLRGTISRHLEAVTGVFEGARDRQTTFTIAEAGASAIARLNRLRSGETDPSAVPTGIAPIDGATGGLHRGEYAVLAGRPSMGKTALGIQIAMNVTAQGHGVIYFSAEMPQALLTPRIIAARMWRPDLLSPSYQAILRGELSINCWRSKQRPSRNDAGRQSGASPPVSAGARCQRIRSHRNSSTPSHKEPAPHEPRATCLAQDGPGSAVST